jgi:hypothetical protein
MKTKTKKTRRVRRGGGYENEYTPSTWSGWFSNLWSGAKQKAENLVIDAKSGIAKANQTLDTDVNLTTQSPPIATPTPTPTPTPTNVATTGGKKTRRKRKRKRNKKGGNAQLVKGEHLQVAKPTYWMNYPPTMKPST